MSLYDDLFTPVLNALEQEQFENDCFLKMLKTAFIAAMREIHLLVITPLAKGDLSFSADILQAIVRLCFTLILKPEMMEGKLVYCNGTEATVVINDGFWDEVHFNTQSLKITFRTSDGKTYCLLC